MKPTQIFILFCLLLSGEILLEGQTIVSTLPQKKNVVLEEFGGIYCVYCPAGHQIIKAIKADHPGRIVHLNYQVDPYAEPNGDDPDFRSGFGSALVDQAGTEGFPMGTINRMVFPGLEQGNPGTTAMSRGDWETAALETLDQDAIVNIAATASVNITTNTLEVYVEYYYTGSSNLTANKLQVAILQNEVFGPQIGGDLGDNYPQENLVRMLLTGQWGEPITQTNSGTYGSRTFSYLLPDYYRNVPFDPFSMVVAVFISENNMNILNGIEVAPSFQIDNDLDIHSLWVATPEYVCQGLITPEIKVRNEGNSPITSFVVDYSIGATGWEYHWDGELSSLDIKTISLPPIPVENISFSTSGIATFQVNISSPNELTDQNISNNAVETSFQKAPNTPSLSLILNMQTDDFGYETYWEITDDAGNVIQSGGNHLLAGTQGGAGIASSLDPEVYGNDQIVIEYIDLPAAGCYTFKILDDYGDGICCNYGSGYYVLTSAEGDILLEGGAFGAKDERLFSSQLGGVTPAEEPAFSGSHLSLSPVPTSGDLFYDAQFDKLVSTYTLDIVDLSGRVIVEKKELATPHFPLSGQISTDLLPNGIYLLRLTSVNQQLAKRFIVAK